MSDTRSTEQFVLDVMSGAARGAMPMALRGLLAIGEPFYASAMRLRNTLYRREMLNSHQLPRPVISVGNITAGGTGKTPMVRWLAESLRDLNPAILMRGYRAELTGDSDEADMLRAQLGSPIPVEAQRDRVAGAQAVLARDPKTGVFILDDGFQHRRVQRDVDLVLVSAVEPFGFGHVHPRGLLREPLSGLARADAIVITRADQVEPSRITGIEATIRKFNPSVPIHRAAHQLKSLIRADGSQAPIEALEAQRAFAFCAIGEPASFFRAIGTHAPLAGSRAFGDHHAYDHADLAALDRLARAAGATMLVTTEKDWAKLNKLPRDRSPLPIARAAMEIVFDGGAGEELLNRVRARVSERSTIASSGASSSAASPAESSPVESSSGGGTV